MSVFSSIKRYLEKAKAKANIKKAKEEIYSKKIKDLSILFADNIINLRPLQKG